MRTPYCSRIIKVLLMAGLGLALLGCQAGPRHVRGELPLVALETLTLNQELATLQVAVRNVNDRHLELETLQLSLSLDKHQAVSLAMVPVHMTIPPRGRDLFEIEVVLDSASQKLLDELAQRNRNNVAWELELVLDPPRARQRAEATGFLHPVPGQPGRFR